TMSGPGPTSLKIRTMPSQRLLCEWRTPGPRGADISRPDDRGPPRALANATCSAGQEILDQPREFRRLLHLGHVTAILDDDKPRAREGTLIDFATIDRRNRVLASPHQQCRRGDAG